jgi:hypothetical protein
LAPKPYTKEERLFIAAQLDIQVDPEDLWLLEEYTWSVSDRYPITWLKREPNRRRPYARLHHCIVGFPIDGRDVDHRDGNTRNNRRGNLQYLTHAANIAKSFAQLEVGMEEDADTTYASESA